jgi:hypothetical protein
VMLRPPRCQAPVRPMQHLLPRLRLRQQQWRRRRRQQQVLALRHPRCEGWAAAAAAAAAKRQAAAAALQRQRSRRRCRHPCACLGCQSTSHRRQSQPQPQRQPQRGLLPQVALAALVVLGCGQAPTPRRQASWASSSTRAGQQAAAGRVAAASLSCAFCHWTCTQTRGAACCQTPGMMLCAWWHSC